MDGKQDLKMYLRNPVRFMEEIFGDPIFKDHLILTFTPTFGEDGCRTFGSAMGGLWAQFNIRALKNGADLLLGLALYIDASYVRVNLTVKPVFGTLLNITEQKRFKEGGVRFLGCLPIYDYDSSLIRSAANRSRRAREMFHDAMALLSNELRIACGQNHKMRAGNGREYLVVPRLAFVAADFQQIQQNTSYRALGVISASAHTNIWTIQSIGGT